MWWRRLGKREGPLEGSRKKTEGRREGRSYCPVSHLAAGGYT